MQGNRTRRTLHLQREAVTLQWTVNADHTGGTVVLLSGKAELYRSSLVRNLRYTFSAEACAVIETFDEAVLQVDGDVNFFRSTLNAYLDEVNALLDTARVDAMIAIEERTKQASSALSSSAELKEAWQGPRVLVVGDSQWERETVVRSLLNLAVRRGSSWGVGFVDVDVSMPVIGVPGTVSAAFVEEPVSGPENFEAYMPLAFFHGSASVTSVSRKRYLDLCVCAAQAGTSLGFAQPKFEAGGLLIHSMSPSNDIHRDLLSDLLSIFAVTHVIVAGANYDLEKLLVNAVLGRTVTFLRAPKMAGVAPPSSSGAVVQRRQQQLEHYFFGTARTPLLPVRGVARLSDLTLLHSETFQPLEWDAVPDLCLAAVVWADTVAAAAEANVAGFVVLVEVGKEFVSFLAPSGGDLPKPFLVVSPWLQLPQGLVMPLYATESA